MFYAHITYRQRLPNGIDAPRAACVVTTNGPFATRESAERYVASVANQTAVLCSVINETEQEEGSDGTK